MILPEVRTSVLIRFSSGANAGLYCHKTVDATGPSRAVWFSDEFTPRYDWTWGGGQFAFVAAVRRFCWARCVCSVGLKKENLTNSFSASDVLKIMAEQNIRENPSSGGMKLENTKTNQAETHVLPPQIGGSNTAGTCGVNGTGFCPMEWPTSILGDVKQMRVPWWEKAQTSVSPPPPPQKAPGCSDFCPGRVSCSDPGPGFPVTCSCKLPSPTAGSRMLGLISISASCLRVFAFISG